MAATGSHYEHAAAEMVIAAARLSLGTPYVHQASELGAGYDCLGLGRGIWREFHGLEPLAPPPYTRDWGEAGGEEVPADTARRFLLEIPIAIAGPGALILVRIGRSAPPSIAAPMPTPQPSARTPRCRWW